MEFTGRQELVVACASTLAGLKESFVANCLKFYKTTTFAPNNERAGAFFEEIFDCLLLRDFDANALTKEFEALITNEQSRQNLLNFALFELVVNFNSPQNAPYVGYFINAISRIRGVLDKSKPQTQTFQAEPKISDQAPQIPSDALFYENPIRTFERMKNAKQKPEFLNLYDGVNIKHEAQILEITDSSVIFGIDVMQILAMKQEGNAFIVPNEYFPKHIRCDIIDFSIAQKSVTLANFTRIPNMSANLRKFQRVHPNRFTKVWLKSGDEELEGNLYDISDGGLSVLSSKAARFRSGERIEANFELLIPHTEQIHSLNLKLNLITELAYKGSIRYCLQIIPNQDTSVVCKFTSERVAQTLEELNALINLYQ